MRFFNKNILFYLSILFFQGIIAQNSKVVAFPGAEGYGRFATGGRGGEVVFVNNLYDSGEGSLRAAIEKEGPRIIVFNVAGNIDLKSPLKIGNDNVTIAGQSAPGDGICIKGYPVSIAADNVILRYLRIRLGDENELEADALGGRQQKNVIIDHCSVSWSIDECVSFYPNQNFTMQWCIVSESLNASGHTKGEHGYGGIWGGNYATFHHNLLAHHKSRNPRFSGSKYDHDIPNKYLDYRNNVIYNWGSNSAYGNEDGKVNIINNYYKAGPATSENVKNRIIQPSEPLGRYYVTGNHVEGYPEISDNNWKGGVHIGDTSLVYQHNEFPAAQVKTHTPAEAYELILAYAGASYKRDGIDKRIAKEVRNGTATYKGSVTIKPGIIDSQEDVGGWPDLESGKIKTDTDKDGMPDAWELAHKLDPNDPADAVGRQLSKYYDNVEVYLNDLVKKITKGQQGEKSFLPSTGHGVEEAYDIIVAADGSGDFKTLQEAFMAVPDFRKNTTTIFLKPGTYKEKLVLPGSKTNVHLIGEDAKKTIVTYDDYASKTNEYGEELGTTGSSSFFIFGDGFQAKNITFENSSGPVGQAVAVRIDGDKVVFENCRFLGFQDTLYPHGRDSRQYYKNCYIEGTTDFIFGWSTAVFEDCEIYSKEGGHYITAASTEESADFGFVFIDCKLTGDAPEETVYLGRPWRNYAQTVFINTKMGEHIKKEGWHNWSKPEAEKTAFYAEYNSAGKGADSKARVSWSKQLSKEEAEKFSVENVLKGKDNWQPTK